MKQDFRKWAHRQIRETPEPWLTGLAMALLCAAMMLTWHSIMGG